MGEKNKDRNTLRMLHTYRKLGEWMKTSGVGGVSGQNVVASVII